MIFRNPAGAPELACDACGCRWFDRMKGTCYECGTPIGAQEQAEYRQALADFAQARAAGDTGGQDVRNTVTPYCAAPPRSR